MQDPAAELPRIRLPRTRVNKGDEEGAERDGSEHRAYATKEGGHKSGAASSLKTPPRFGSVTLQLPRLVLQNGAVPTNNQRDEIAGLAAVWSVMDTSHHFLHRFPDALI
jgi:hypothetical protein